MPKIKITLPDGSEQEYEKGITPKEIAFKIGERLGQAALAAEVDGKIVDLFIKIKKDSKLRIITFKDKEGIDIFRHSSAHLLASAIIELFPDALPTIGPVVEEGFYYDFDVKEPFHPDDLVKIEKKMEELVKKDISFDRIELSKDEAKKIFKDNPYKIELIEEAEKPSIYKTGKFSDLCRGPHVPSTGYLKSYKLTKISGAYWRGDVKNKQLQRIYGISFPDKKLLKEYLTVLEEAQKRDHVKLGKQLDLFSIHPEAPGMPFFHDKGLFIFNKLIKFMRIEMKKRNYTETKTPLILEKGLWEQSGHWDHYQENMYFTKVDNREFAVKPMNCPGNLLVYKTKVHSYRELPLKSGEFGLVHRHELSGVLNGLFRVRVFTQDDAHIFCEESQLQKQIIELIELCDLTYKTFGFSFEVELSTKPEKAMGSKKIWDKSESVLKKALDSKKLKFKLNEGDGAFYGPKIDFHIKDALGRRWQCATIQVDFSMPEKFDLTYEGKDGKKHRPVMLHRTIFGSLERFIGILIEHFAGKFPLWISPIQVKVLTVADRFEGYGKKVVEELKKYNIRAELDARTESVGYKVREAQLQKIPIILNVGEKEENNKTVAVRTLDGKLQFGVKVKDLVKKILDNVEKKEIKY